MKIQIIVENFNGEKFLERCVNSIRNQNHEDIEIFIYDKGSSDLSRTIIDRMQKADQRIKIGMPRCNSDAIVKIDSRNCMVNLNFLKIANDAMEKSANIGIVTGLIQSFDDKNIYIGTLGKINGMAEKSPFGKKDLSDFRVYTRSNINLDSTVLPVPASVIRNRLGDVLFIHSTVVKNDGDPKRIEIIDLMEYPEEIEEVKPAKRSRRAKPVSDVAL